MQIEVQINKDAVQQQVVSAILDSAIGEQISTAIKKSLTEVTGEWNDRKTLVQRAVDNALMNKVRDIAMELVNERAGEIRQQLAEKLTGDVLEEMTGVLWGFMSGRLNRN